MKNWMIVDIAETAFRHGQGYAENNIYRNTGKYVFKNPEVVGLPNWVTQIDIETHQWLADLYKHSFRAGLKSNKGA